MQRMAVKAEILRQTHDDGVLCWAQLPLWRTRVLTFLAKVAPVAPVLSTSEFAALNHLGLPALLAARLPQLFHSVRGYHACSPVDLAGYYVDGLQPLSVSAANDFLRGFYLSDRFPELTPGDLDSAIASVGSHGREGLIWFGLDDRGLEETCGQYLIYGSEYVLSVAASLRRALGRDYQGPLRGRGRPTVFACDIPVSWFSPEALRELSHSILETLAREGVVDDSEAPEIDHSFALSSPVSAVYIQGHHHPVEVIDYLQEGRPIRYQAGTG